MKYRSAQLVKGKSRGVDNWYIVYYQTDPRTGEVKRHRETHDMNRIGNRRTRLKFANKIILEINEKLPYGYPHNKNRPSILLEQTNIKDAIQVAVDLKCQSDRKKTVDMYKGNGKLFIQWAEKTKIADMKIIDFSKSRALGFMDHILLDRKVQNYTYNNYLRVMKTLFYVLVERGYITQNPFVGIKKRKITTSARIPFDEKTKSVVAAFVKKEDPLLMLAILLMYHCLIRPAELRRLRFHHVNLEEGLIKMPGKITKNKKASTVTIPMIAIDALKAYKLDQYNPEHYIFGAYFVMGDCNPLGQNTMRNRYQKLLRDLIERGAIAENVCKDLYLWKYMGGQDLMQQDVSLITLVKHFRHSDAQTTQIYLDTFQGANEEIRNSKNRLI